MQESLIHPGVNVDAVAGSHLDEVLQAGAVSRHFMRIVRLDRGEKPLLGRRDLYLQLLTHEGHLLPGADLAGWRAGVANGGRGTLPGVAPSSNASAGLRKLQ